MREREKDDIETDGGRRMEDGGRRTEDGGGRRTEDGGGDDPQQ